MKRGEPGYWEWRKNTGRRKKLKSPAELWQLACDYFNSVDEAPFKKQDFIRGGELAGSIVEMDSIRPYTWQSLEAYVFEQIGLTDLEDYRYNTDGRYEEFRGIVRAINKIIFGHNFDGAAVGALSHNLIAKQLGIAEKVINQNLNTDDPIDYSKLSDSALEEIVQQKKEHESKTKR